MPQIKKSDVCPNCSQFLSGENYCPNCGQKNDVRRIPFGRLVTESLTNLFAFDGRLGNTVRNLFARPGKVPRDFVNGKRVRYMNPVRLYFLTSIILLIVVRLATIDSVVKIDRSESSQVENEGVPEEFQRGIEDAENAQRNLPKDTAETATILSEEGLSGKIFAMMGYYERHPETTMEESFEDMNIEDSFWNRFLFSQAVKLHDLEEDEANQYLMSKLSWVLFFFLPILALLQKLIYVRRGFYYVEHLIFAFYSQSVFFIFISPLILVHLWVDSALLRIIVLLLFLVYLLISFKRFYGQNWWKTGSKVALLNLILIPTFGLFFLLSLIVLFILL